MRIHIAGDKERLVCRSRHLPDDRQGKHPVFLGQRKVRTAINILFKFYDKQRTGFFPSRQGQITIAKRLLLAQHADTIFPAIVINCRGIHMMHQGESGNFPQDVFSSTTACHTVDLLYCHDIGTNFIDHCRRTPKVGHIVHSSTVTDVITHNAQSIILALASLLRVDFSQWQQHHQCRRQPNRLFHFIAGFID